MPRIFKNLFKSQTSKRRQLPVFSAVSQFARKQLYRMALLNQGLVSMSMEK
jgi:hypothetical protein